MKKDRIERCYNCGRELKDGKTKEHIPARTLFEGYDDLYKTNRITVPACFECNNRFSLTDEEFRNMIGVIAKREKNNAITHKAVASIIRKDADHRRLLFDFVGEVRGVDFSMLPIVEFNKKNFKGLFYHQYGFPLPSDYEIIVNDDENDFSDFTLGCIGYLKDHFEWRYSSHKDILSYCIQPFRPGVVLVDKKDLKIEDKENIVIGMLVYNQEYAAMVIAIRKEYLEEIRSRNEL